MKKIIRQAKSFVPTNRPRSNFQPIPDYRAVPDDADYDDLRFAEECGGAESQDLTPINQHPAPGRI